METMLANAVKSNPPLFFNDTLVNIDSFIERNNIILKSDYTTKQEDIPMSQIKGVAHAFYDSTWGECFNQFERMARNLKRLEDNPSYYQGNHPMRHMSFTKIGEHYFIREGKHRTVIARFLAHYNPSRFAQNSPLRGISVTEHKVDYELMGYRDRCIG